MTSVSSAWGTPNEWKEWLHPRDRYGRFKEKFSAGHIAAVIRSIAEKLDRFNPRMFGSNNQAAQWATNLGHANPKSRGMDMHRFTADFHDTNAHLRSGDMDESTKKFVDMMDNSSFELPNDVIMTRVVGPEAFGYDPQTINGVEDLPGRLFADRGYSFTTIGEAPKKKPGQITMTMAVPKGTRVNLAQLGPNDRTMVLNRDQEYRVTKVTPDGMGGYNMMAITTDRTPGETPTPEGGPELLGPRTPQERESTVTKMKGIREEARKARKIETGEEAERRHQLEAQQQQNEIMRSQQGQPQQPQQPTIRESPTGPTETGPAGPAPRQEEIAHPAIGTKGGATQITPRTTPEQAPETGRIAQPVSLDFRRAARNANLEPPSSGPRRAEWNRAYQGVASGKKHPEDVLRDLEKDIDVNREKLDRLETGGHLETDPQLRRDIRNQEDLANLIRQEHGLGPRPAPEKAAPVKKAAPKKAAPKLAPVIPIKRGGGKAPEAPAAPEAPSAPEAPAPAKAAPNLPAVKAVNANKIQGEGDGYYQNIAKNVKSGEWDTGRARAEADKAERLWRGREKIARDRGRTESADNYKEIADRYGKLRDDLGVAPVKKAAPAKAAPTKIAKKAVPTPAEVSDLDTTVPELKKIAATEGVSLRGKTRKADIQQAIRDKREGKIPEPSAASPATELQKMLKKDLIELGQKEGVPVNPKQTKAQIAQAIEDFRVHKEGGLGDIAREQAALDLKEMVKGTDVEFGKENKDIFAEANQRLKNGADPGDVADFIEREVGGKESRLEKARFEATEKKGLHETPKQYADRKAFADKELEDAQKDATGWMKIAERLRENRRVPAKKAAPAKKVAPTKALRAEREARGRQAEIDKNRNISEAFGDISQVIADGGSPEALRNRINSNAEVRNLDPEIRQRLLDAVADSGDQSRLAGVLRELEQENGLTRFHAGPGTITTFDPKTMVGIGDTSIPEGASVRVVRPGHRSQNGAVLSKSTVEAHKPEVEAPAGQKPIEAKDRKADFDKAWDESGIKVPRSAAGRSMKEIRGDISSGKITPDEGIRRLENDIEFNKNDLTAVERELRGPGLGPVSRGRLEETKIRLQTDIKAQESASKWMRNYFEKKAPVVTPREIQMELPPDMVKALDEATPESLREAAKISGLGEIEGDNKDEVLQNIVKKLAQKELDRRAGKKAVKKIAPPKAPATPKPDIEESPYKRLDINALAEGLNLSTPEDKKLLGKFQDLLDGKEDRLGRQPTPAAVGRDIDMFLDGPSSPFYRAAITNAMADKRRIGESDADFNKRVAEMRREADQETAIGNEWRKLADRLKNTRRVRKEHAPETSTEKPKLSAPEKADIAKVAEVTGIPKETLVKKAVAKKVAEAPPKPDAQSVVDTLKTINSREEAADLLKGRTRDELKEVAKAAGAPYAPSSTKTTLMGRILEATGVGTRANNRGGGETLGLNRDRLMDPDQTSLSDLTDLEEEFQIKRGSLNRADRVDAIMEAFQAQRETQAPTPVERAARETEVGLRNQEIENELAKERAKAAKLPEPPKKSFADLSPEDVQNENLVREAYREVRGPRPAGLDAWIGMADLRERLDAKGMSREQQDAIFKKMLLGPAGDYRNEGRLRIIPVANSKALKPRDREAAFYLGGEPKHAVAFGDPSPLPVPGKAKATAEKAVTPGFTDILRRLQESGRSDDPMSREEATKILADLKTKAQLLEAAKSLNIPRASTLTAADLRGEIVNATVGRKLDSIAIRGFKGDIKSPLSIKPILENHYGGAGGEINYHEDGAIGVALGRMGDRDRLDVDGEPLRNVMGKMATDLVRGNTTQQETIDQLKKLRDRINDERAKRGITRAIDDMEQGLVPIPKIPDGTPGPLRELLEAFARTPLARQGRHGHGEEKAAPLESLMEIIRDITNAKEQYSRYGMLDRIQNLMRQHHESREGYYEIRRAVNKAVEEMKKNIKANFPQPGEG